MYVTAPAPAPTKRFDRRAKPRHFVPDSAGATRPASSREARILAIADSLDRVARGVQEAATDYDVEPQGIRLRIDTLGMLEVVVADLADAMRTLTTLHDEPWGEHAALLTRDMVQRPLAEMLDAFRRRGDGYSRHRSIDLQRSLVVRSAAAISGGLQEVVAAGA